MKNKILLLLLFIQWNASAQELKNTEWVKIKAERKDGSKIVSRIGNPAAGSIKYFFKDSTVLTTMNEQYSAELKYSVTKGIISIGDYLSYNVDTINNIVLAVTEIPVEELPPDKINSFVFIKSTFLFEYLKETNEIKLGGDSIIFCDKVISPSYIGKLDTLFTKKFKQNLPDGKVSGYLLISAEGKVKGISLDTNSKFPAKATDEIKTVLNSTSGRWVVPKAPKDFSFRIDFNLKAGHMKSGVYFNFFFHDNERNQLTPNPTFDELAEVKARFNSGVENINKGKFEKAAGDFSKCIEMDSLNIDAYYNLAYAYEKLGNKSLTCETLKKLKDLGQKQGEALYNENCR